MDKVAGGSFIFDDIDFEKVFTPEDFTDEHRMIAETTEHFVVNELLPHDEKMESLDYGLTVEMIRKSGQLGLLGADVPEQYGGLSLDKISSIIISEKMARSSSFSVTIGGQTGIGSLPIVFFGTDEQKRKYLPDLVSGEKISAYCLTEASSGSDALSIKTTATLSEDGKHYILNGSKQFITNAGFADIFIVYAKVNGTDFSAFIVERSMEGFGIGAEEKKMGLKGSSTCSLTLEDVKVPVQNLLGEVGKGHLIAFNILNIGRLKLAAVSLGLSKNSIEYSVKYANQRKQFKRKISSFPLIGKKLAEMNIKTYVLESMVYRTVGLLDQSLGELDQTNSGFQSAKAISEYALECSINKVFGSEAIGFVADEGVQIHGGYGYIQEYMIERIYRDCRIYRIFEGSNEINRLLIPGTLIKRVLKGNLQLMEKAKEVQAELQKFDPSRFVCEGILEQETHLVAMAKKLFLMTISETIEKYQSEYDQEQEILSNLADMMIHIYAMESALLRTKKLISRIGEDKSQTAIHMTIAFIHETFERILAWAKESLTAMDADRLQTLLLLSKWAAHSLVNTIALKRQIAARVTEAEKYVV
jgi:alkylation response protein AidB-like acyl-CoA dehydrogenase